MPPESSPGIHNSLDDHGSLSDQNVAILYEIVQVAESQANVDSQPFRALFAAYDAVLPRYGIDPAHDQIYLRFLFKLGRQRQRSETLFETFERFLKELEIQIEFVNKDDGSVAPDDDRTQLSRIENEKAPPRRPQRRASLSAIYDIEDEISRELQSDRRSQPSLWASPDIGRRTDAAPSSQRSSGAFTERHEDHPSARRSLSGSSKSKIKMQLSSQQKHPSHERLHSALAAGASATRRDTSDSVWSTPSRNVAEDNSIGASPTDESGFQTGGFYVPSLPKLLSEHIPADVRLYHPTRSQLLRDVDTFQHYRIRAVARDAVDRWCDAALQARNHREHLHRMAVARDTEILLRQAFEHWRLRLHARKQAADTERYFKRLSDRASKARDIYLLAKAFSHWRSCTNDEQNQRALSRQKVIAVKYFHAWRHFAIDRKAEACHALEKQSLLLWGYRWKRVTQNSDAAHLLYGKRRTKSAYWKWFWSFCERRAPEWHERKSSHWFVLCWWRKSQHCTAQLLMSKRFSEAHTCGRMITKWVAKTRRYASDVAEAQAFTNRNTTSRTVSAWASASRLAPGRRAMSNMVDWRVARSNFALMVHRLRLVNQAQKLEGLRNLRLRWTEWNDHLRCHTLQGQINDRHMLEVLYKWVVAERFQLLHRLLDQRLSSQYWHAWKQGIAKRLHGHHVLLDRHLATKDRVLLQSAFGKWTTRAEEHASSDKNAHRRYASKITFEATIVWEKVLQIRRDAENDVADVREYFLLRRNVRHWRDRVQTSKRQKRKESYIIVRRNMKMRIVSQTLRHWRSRTDHLLQLLEESMANSAKNTSFVGKEIFELWARALSPLIDHGLVATAYHQRRISIQALGFCYQSVKHQGRLEQTARTNWELQRQKTSFLCLRKLRLRLIEIRSLRGRMEGLNSDYERRRYSSTLRLWNSKATARREMSSSPSILERLSTKPSGGLGDGQRAFTQSTQCWSDLDTRDWTPQKSHDNLTPFPGYLSTPSRRAAHARALIQSTTPKGTPFQSRLRAQLNVTPRAPTASSFGRSLGFGSNRVHSRLEESPIVPQKLGGGAGEARNDDITKEM